MGIADWGLQISDFGFTNNEVTSVISDNPAQENVEKLQNDFPTSTHFEFRISYPFLPLFFGLSLSRFLSSSGGDTTRWRSFRLGGSPPSGSIILGTGRSTLLGLGSSASLAA